MMSYRLWNSLLRDIILWDIFLRESYPRLSWNSRFLWLTLIIVLRVNPLWDILLAACLQLDSLDLV